MSTQDLIAAIAAMRATEPPAPPAVRIAGMIAVPVVVGLILAILGWVGTGVSGLSTSTAQIQVSLATVQKTVDSLSAGQADTVKQLSDINTRLGQHDLRLNSLETRYTQMNDRMRIKEGQQPLHPVDPMEQ